ncbi:hypothetical protein Sango_0769200 [Sesamum angolense]|uniref:Uncharacterized protein n=1 Tax=Sesamum angolense TaxID=2727404 RepID=A0AAE1X2L5_9LAMI|nr:hypothetical protein Sango_0769200 [Sesamum angolense]
MADVRQQLQQKPESTENDTHSEFERGLEELMRGHYDEYMSFASCSSPRTTSTEDEEDEGEQLVRRRRRSDLDGDDLAESSAARRRQSRILSRWAARQAQEMITTIERRNRESELMALAGLHTVSMLDSSFLRESQFPTSRRQGNVERLSTRASSILQMWRELEDEHALTRARERVRERLRQRRSVDSNTNASVNMSEGREGENQGSQADASESENDYGTWSHDQLSRQNENRDHDNSSREQSPDLGEVERERRNDSPRAEWLGETERERVRIVREWMQMTSQQRGSRSGRREERDNEPAPQADSARGGSAVDQDEGQPEHIRRDMLRLRGRQALLDLLVRIERERQRELQGLQEHRAVSDFAHRNRIQGIEEERPPSMAASELNQLRQRQSVSGLRVEYKLFVYLPPICIEALLIPGRLRQRRPLWRLAFQVVGRTCLCSWIKEMDTLVSFSLFLKIPGEATRESGSWCSIARSHGKYRWQHGFQSTNQHVAPDQESHRNGQITEEIRANRQQRNDISEDQDGNGPVNAVSDWPSEAVVTEDGGPRRLPQTHEVWQNDGSREAVDNWSDGPSDPPRMRRSVPYRRVARRSVSNLLRSGFRESLDQLIQSYVERRGRAPMDWDLHRNLPLPPSPERDQDQQNNEQNDDQRAATDRPTLVLPTPPVPPPQPLWHQDLHHSGWSRHNVHRPEIVFGLMVGNFALDDNSHVGVGTQSIIPEILL